jgi:hypothetical protein
MKSRNLALPGLSNGEKVRKGVPTGNGILVDGGSIFAGGTTNSGTISALHTGILLRGTTTFTGGVTNSGAISAGGRGIAVGTGSGAAAAGVSTFAGNVLNNGKITAATGVAVLGGSIVLGAIVDSGTIVATSHGILIDSASEILAGSNTAIDIAGRTFTGGITNFGVISGSAGIEIASAHAVSIFDAGTIIGAGGTAIEFTGSGNTLTLGAGYSISGAVDPSGSNTFQLGGSGSDTFDLFTIGQQFNGFTTFNVVGGTWTVSGGGLGWNSIRRTADGSGAHPRRNSGRQPFVVPDLVGHRQAGKHFAGRRLLRRNAERLKRHHELAHVLARMPGGPLEILVQGHVAVVDVGLVGKIASAAGTVPPGLEPPYHVRSIGQ